MVQQAAAENEIKAARGEGKAADIAEALAAQATVRMLRDAGHVLVGQTDAIESFLSGDCHTPFKRVSNA